jgi:hypothetical protein
MRDPLMSRETYETDYQRARREWNDSKGAAAQIPCYDCGGTLADCGCYVIEDLSAFAFGVLVVAGVVMVGAALTIGGALGFAGKLRGR